MKKLILIALLATGLSGFAQEKSKKDSSEKILKKMITELSLSTDQQDKLKPILEEQAALKKDSKDNPDHAEPNKSKDKEIAKKIKEVLTPEQITIQNGNKKKSKGEEKEGKEKAPKESKEEKEPIVTKENKREKFSHP